MMAIDFHTHILPPELIATREECCQRDRWFGTLYANPRARLASAEELLSSMDGAAISAAVAFGFAFVDPGLCRTCNDYVLEAARRYPGRLVPFAVVSPRAQREAAREARRCLEAGAAGLGELMPQGQEFDLTDYHLLDSLMEVARDAAAPIMVHVNELVGHDYPGKCGQGPFQAYELAARYPANTLVLPHWGGGLPFYELMPEVRATLRNVYYDTAASPFLYDDHVFRHVVAWAPGKVLWGSDYPLLKQKPFLRRVARTLQADALADVLGNNALRALGRVAMGPPEGA